MISLQLTSPWSVCTPQVHRYLPTRYVEEFFADGSLRLSSVKLFRKHVDEQRRDPNEGIANFFHRTTEGGGQTIVARAEQADNAYILCGGTYYSIDLMVRFDFLA